jgi:hypothetical protein
MDGILSKIHKHKPIKIIDDIEKKVVEIVPKIQERLWTAIFNMVLKNISWHYFQRDEH